MLWTQKYVRTQVSVLTASRRYGSSQMWRGGVHMTTSCCVGESEKTAHSQTATHVRWRHGSCECERTDVTPVAWSLMSLELTSCTIDMCSSNDVDEEAPASPEKHGTASDRHLLANCIHNQLSCKLLLSTSYFARQLCGSVASFHVKMGVGRQDYGGMKGWVGSLLMFPSTVWGPSRREGTPWMWL